MVILDSTDNIAILVGEETTPSCFEPAVQGAGWDHVGERKCGDDGVINDDQEDQNDG